MGVGLEISGDRRVLGKQAHATRREKRVWDERTAFFFVPDEGRDHPKCWMNIEGSIPDEYSQTQLNGSGTNWSWTAQPNASSPSTKHNWDFGNEDPVRCLPSLIRARPAVLRSAPLAASPGTMAEESSRRSTTSFTAGLWSQYKAYEGAFVERAKGTISDALVLASEHQAEAIGCATVAGLILLRGPRRFLYRHTFGRLKTEKDLLNDAEQSILEYKTSIETLKKDSKYTLDKIAIGESDLQRGQTDLRASGKQIQSLISSIYKAESTATGLMDRLRTIPTRQSLELRAEVASMASDLKNQRNVLEQRINKISEYGVHV